MKNKISQLVIISTALALSACDSSSSKYKGSESAEAPSEQSGAISPDAPAEGHGGEKSEDNRLTGFNPTESKDALMDNAKNFQSCALASVYLSIISQNTYPEKSKSLVSAAKFFHNIAIGYGVLAGLDKDSANTYLKSQEYSENDIMSEINSQIKDGNNSEAEDNVQILTSNYKDCEDSIKNGKSSKTLIYVVRNFTK